MFIAVSMTTVGDSNVVQLCFIYSLALAQWY